MCSRTGWTGVWPSAFFLLASSVLVLAFETPVHLGLAAISGDTHAGTLGVSRDAQSRLRSPLPGLDHQPLFEGRMPAFLGLGSCLSVAGDFGIALPLAVTACMSVACVGLCLVAVAEGPPKTAQTPLGLADGARLATETAIETAEPSGMPLGSTYSQVPTPASTQSTLNLGSRASLQALPSRLSLSGGAARRP